MTSAVLTFENMLNLRLSCDMCGRLDENYVAVPLP